jgi:hypothetical protein
MKSKRYTIEQMVRILRQPCLPDRMAEIEFPITEPRVVLTINLAAKECPRPHFVWDFQLLQNLSKIKPAIKPS